MYFLIVITNSAKPSLVLNQSNAISTLLLCTTSTASCKENAHVKNFIAKLLTSTLTTSITPAKPTWRANSLKAYFFVPEIVFNTQTITMAIKNTIVKVSTKLLHKHKRPNAPSSFHAFCLRFVPSNASINTSINIALIQYARPTPLCK